MATLTPAGSTPNPEPPRRKPGEGLPFRPPFFYGWVILAVCIISTTISGATSQLFVSIMVKPMTEELGWTRTELAGALLVGVVATALLSPVLGRLADRHGPRWLMVAASVAVTAGFFAIAAMQNLWQFYVAYVVCRGVSQASLSGVVATTTVTNWFSRKRGRAVGLLATAFQFSTSFMAPISQFIIVTWSWRWVYALLGAITVAAVTIPAGLLLRRRPEDVGLHPDGATESASPTTARGALGSNPEMSFTVQEAMRTSSFWLLGAGTFVVMMINGSMTFHLVSYYTDIGISTGVAALCLSLFAISSGWANTIWGYLAERFSERAIGVGGTLLGGLGMVGLIFVRSELLAPFITVYYAFTSRGEGSVLNLIVAKHFGRASFGAVSGALQPIGYVGLGLGPLIGSMIFDSTGSYLLFLQSLVVLHGLAAVLLALDHPPKLPPRLAAP